MTKTTDEARNKNDENRENENPIINTSKLLGDIKSTLNTPRNASATTKEKNNVNQATTTLVTLNIL